MSIRSYKDIYAQFVSLFPELATAANTWKGVKFSCRHIVILMKDNTVLGFWYMRPGLWALVCKDKNISKIPGIPT